MKTINTLLFNTIFVGTLIILSNLANPTQVLNAYYTICIYLILYLLPLFFLSLAHQLQITFHFASSLVAFLLFQCLKFGEPAFFTPVLSTVLGYISTRVLYTPTRSSSSTGTRPG